MFKFLSGNVWKSVFTLAKKSKVKKAAIAYVSTDTDIKFGNGDLLFVDASRQAIASGETSAQVIGRALRAGAKVYSCPGLHSKAMLFDNVAVIGSANLSQSSQHDLIEAALITDQPRMVASIADFLNDLKRLSDRVDTKFVARIKKIPVIRRGRRGGMKRNNIRARHSTPKVWVLGTTDLDEDAFPAEHKRVEKGTEIADKQKTKASSTITWFRITGTSRFRKAAKPGDVIINICRERREDAPYAVYKSLLILRKQQEPSCTRFYTEFFADSDRNALTWRQFQSLIKRAQLPQKVTRYSTREIPENYADAIFALWDEVRQ